MRNGQIVSLVAPLLSLLPTFLQMAIRYYYDSSWGFIIISCAQIPIIWLKESAHFVMAQDYVFHP